MTATRVRSARPREQPIESINAVRAIAVLTCLGALAAQGRIYVVDANNGPGTDFTALPPAVAAARAGDILRVRAGAYEYVVIDKGLRVVGEPGAEISIPTATTSQPLRIENIAAGETCAIAGLRVPPGIGLSLVEVIGCAGRVVLERVEIELVGPTVASPLRIASCATVVVAHCTTRNGTVSVYDSTATLIDCTCTGSVGLLTLPGSPALYALMARVAIAFGSFTGGDSFSSALAWSGTGMRMVDSEVAIAGDATTAFVAGNHSSIPVPAIDGLRSSLTLHPAVALVPFGVAPGVAPAISRTTLALPGLRVRGAPLGGSTHVALASAPGRPFAVVLGGLGTRLPLIGLGALWLDPSAPMVTVAAGIQSVGGVHGFAVSVPLAPALVGSVFAWQGVGEVAGSLRLSNVDAYLQG